MAIPAYYSLIQKGSYGPDEALVQTWLNGVRDQCSYYPALTTDGRFGTRSENAVKEFQLRNNMNMDGKVGANTWNVLYAKYTAKHGLAVPYPGIVMRTGMSGGTIRLIQQKLNTLGEKIGTDGKFGSRTAAAVQRFQRYTVHGQDKHIVLAVDVCIHIAVLVYEKVPVDHVLHVCSDLFRRQSHLLCKERDRRITVVVYERLIFVPVPDFSYRRDVLLVCRLDKFL